MVVGIVVVGYNRECTREISQEQLGTLKKFKGKFGNEMLGLLLNQSWLVRY